MKKVAFEEDEEDETYATPAQRGGGVVATKELLVLRFGLGLCAVALIASLTLGGAWASPVYDPKAVPWTELGSDLDAFVASCNCAPILVRLSWHDSVSTAAPPTTTPPHPAHYRAAHVAASSPTRALYCRPRGQA